MVYLKLISERVAGIFSNNKDLYYAVSDDYGNREYRKYRGEIVEITEEEYFKAFYGELYEPMVARFGDRSTSQGVGTRMVLSMCAIIRNLSSINLIEVEPF